MITPLEADLGTVGFALAGLLLFALIVGIRIGTNGQRKRHEHANLFGAVQEALRILLRGEPDALHEAIVRLQTAIGEVEPCIERPVPNDKSIDRRSY